MLVNNLKPLIIKCFLFLGHRWLIKALRYLFSARDVENDNPRDVVLAVVAKLTDFSTLVANILKALPENTNLK